MQPNSTGNGRLWCHNIRQSSSATGLEPNRMEQRERVWTDVVIETARAETFCLGQGQGQGQTGDALTC